MRRQPVPHLNLDHSLSLTELRSWLGQACVTAGWATCCLRATGCCVPCTLSQALYHQKVMILIGQHACCCP